MKTILSCVVTDREGGETMTTGLVDFLVLAG